MRVRDPQFQIRCLIYFGLTAITLALYLPALQHSFVEYDDQQYVTENPRVQTGITWAGFIWAFGFHAGNWHPLAWLSHMLDCQLFGARAWGHHLTGILLHTGTTLLLFAVLQRMTGFLWRSAAVAALFAWHPLHVESVAWVAERKDVLCAFFWMLTLWFYVRYVERTSIVRYLTMLGVFALCLMSKPMAVTLPFVLLLLDFWPLQRLNTATPQKLAVEKIPFFILSVLGCWLTLQAQQLAIVSTAGLPVSQRIVHTLVAYDHYFGAVFFPVNLAVYYPFEFQLSPLLVAWSAIVVVGITALALANWKRRPWLLFGWLWFLGTLVPVIGLVQVGDQAWADRYTYLPLIGLFVPLAWLAAGLVKNQKASTIIFLGAGTVMLVATSVQLSYWQNTKTLFGHAAQVTQRNALAVTVLGSQLAQENKLDEAMKYYQTALEYTPNFPEAHFYLGNALDVQGKSDDAVAEYKKALWFKPMQEQTHIFLAIVLAKQHRYDEAIEHYNEVLRMDPDSAVTHNNLARIFHTQGKWDEAMAHYRAALEINPKLTLAHNNLGILLLQQGRLADGTVELRQALQLNSTNSETQFNLAVALNQQQQWSEAAKLLAGTVTPASRDPKAHYEYARALAHTRKTREAMGEFAAALLLQPDYPEALDGLAWILATDASATNRNGTQAVAMSEQACALTGNKDTGKLKTLAAAYAETGNFSDAIKTIQSVTLMDTNRTGETRAMLNEFQAARPWRNP